MLAANILISLNGGPMKLIAIAFVIVVQSSLLHANRYYPTEYKRLMKRGLVKDNDLKNMLYEIVAGNHMRTRGGDDVVAPHCNGSDRCYSHKPLGYKSARRVLFGELHLEKDSEGYFVRDVYCEKKITRRVADVGPGVIPNHNVINCEHTWPKSRFSGAFDKSIQKSDLHHLFPTDSKTNNERGSDEFGEVNGYPIDNCSASRNGAEKLITGRYFEPPEAHRGNVARALFYFAVRYKLKIRETEESFLRKWHEDDPVDEEEMDRNDSIHEIQGNRNPFIDYPELVDQISNF